LQLEIKGRVVGGDSLDEAVAEAVPQDLLVLAVAQGRGHDEFRALKIGPLGVGFVEGEILDEGFDGHADAALAGGDGLGQGFLAA